MKMTGFKYKKFVGRSGKETNLPTPQGGLKEATKEPLKFGSIPEAIDITNKLGSRAEKRQAYLYIAKNLDDLEIPLTMKEWIKEKIISKLKDICAVPELGELKAVDALKCLAQDIFAFDRERLFVEGGEVLVPKEDLKEILKKLEELKAVDVIEHLAQDALAPDEFVKIAKEKIRKLKK